MKDLLSWTTKMPCPSWGIPAIRCNIGGILRKVVGSVCERCYARRGFYTMPNVQRVYEERLRMFDANPRGWVEAMVERLGREDARKPGVFRWFDSGDIQGERMLEAILEVVKRTPWLVHRLPTKEYELVRGLKEIPDNLVIQVSSPMIDRGFEFKARVPVQINGVTSDPAKATCPAHEQGDRCGDCRKCWTRDVKSVVYLKH